MAEHYSEVLDRFNANGDLYRLNHTSDEIEVDPILVECLNLSIAYQDEFDGYFSYTLGNVKDLYDASYKEGLLPDASLLSEKLLEANATSVEINGNKVRRIGEGTIDLGGIAKGFYLKKAKEILEEKHLEYYMFNLGHSSILFGKFSERLDYFEVKEKGYENIKFTAKSTSLSTSSILEQSIIIDDVTYTHIINPKDGSTRAKYEVVTLLGDDPCYLDAATTAYMNMDLSAIRASNLRGLVIQDGRIIYSHDLH